MKKKIILSIIILSIIIVISFLYIKLFNLLVIEQNITTNSNFNSDTTILERLIELSYEDQRINSIIEDYNNYPEEILNMLSRNIETLDFVLNYQEKVGRVFADDIGKVKKGEFPLILQWDERWGYGSYGDSSIAVNGCACASLSMVIAGLTGNNRITPYIIAKYAEVNGYYTNGGTSWSLMTDGVKYFDIIGIEISLSKNNIYDNLKKGNPIICSMRPGDFTTEGHFIVLTGIVDGKIKVNDPNSLKRSYLLWDYETLEYQIKNLWVFLKE